MRSGKAEYFLVLIAVFFSAFMLLFNDVNIEIRLREMKIFLQKSNLRENNLDHISLIMKFQLGKRLYENRIATAEADAIELRVNTVLSQQIETENVSVARYENISRPVLLTINFLRTIMGKQPILDIESNESTIYHDLAYYYERNKNYKKAITLYNTALQNTVLKREVRGNILLHRGFCLSLMGKFNEAKKTFKEIISNYNDDTISITAAILLNYIDNINSEISRVKKTPDSIKKGEKLFRLVAFRESLGVLDRIQDNASDGEKINIKYYRARCLEELSKKDEAIDCYQEIISDSPKSEFAKNANRRIYLMGVLDYNGSTMTNLARWNNKIIKDPGLDKMITDNSRIPVNNTFIKKLSENTEMKKIYSGIEKNKPEISSRMLESLKHEIKRTQAILKKKKTRVTSKSIVKKYKIFINDGNVFVGTISEETLNYIKLKGLLGEIKISKKTIVKKLEL